MSRGDSRVRPSRLDVRDLVTEALAGVLRRPHRALLASLGTALGVAAFVVVLGLTAAASARVGSRFDTGTATQVVVEDAGGPRDVEIFPDPFPPDAEARLSRVDGVLGGGLYWRVPRQGEPVRTVPGASAAGEELPVIAASPGLFAAVDARLAAGRTFDGFHDRVAAHVAVVGPDAADRLRIGALDAQPAVVVEGVPYTVIGVLHRVARLPELMGAVIIPAKSATAVAPTPDARPRMLVATRPGAVGRVAHELPAALRPDAPDALRAVPPDAAATLRDPVGADLRGLFLVLAVVCPVIGAATIANATVASILQRRPEIGLRRALGARTAHIVGQFVAEAATLGALGGLFGTSLGVLTVVVVALWRDWPPLAQPWIVVLAPIVGVVVGAAAGAYPAVRAGRVEPGEALRR